MFSCHLALTLHVAFSFRCDDQAPATARKSLPCRAQGRENKIESNLHAQRYPTNNKEICIHTGEPRPQRKTDICTHSVGLPLRNRPCKNLPAISTKSPQLSRVYAFQQRFTFKTEGHVQAQSQMTREHGRHPCYQTSCMKEPCLWSSRM